MPIDPKQFMQTFIEESIELLQGMEEALIALDINAIDYEKINIAFRTVHSIKSSSAMFNLNDISELSQKIETYLQPLRAKEKKITRADIDLLLETIDSYRKILTDLSTNKPIDTSQIKNLMSIFSQLASGADSKYMAEKFIASEIIPDVSEKKIMKGWRIRFRPIKETFLNGNEPTRLFATLSELGKLEVQADTTELPLLNNIDPKFCYLTWNIVLHTDVNINEIQEIFSWMAEEENYHFTPLEEATTEVNAPESEPITESEPRYISNNLSPKKIEPVKSTDVTKEIKEEKGGVKFGGTLQATSIRVATQKVDNLVNLIGELIITQSMINQITKDFTPDKLEKLNVALSRLDFDSRNLQEGILSIRMLPIAFVFNRLPRMLHDISQKIGKRVELNIFGEETEIDKNMMEKIFNPLVHIVRNAVDHGIEAPELREKGGKDPKGTIQLYAFHEGGNIVINVEDDGAGISIDKIKQKAIQLGMLNENDHLSDDDIYQFIFKPGFSTSEVVTDISGRGVGLDVVYSSVKELGGNIEISSTPGVGTKFSLSLPITLSIMDCQLIRISKQTYCIPLVSIVEIIKINNTDIINFDHQMQLYRLRDKCIPMIDLMNEFNIQDTVKNKHKHRCLIVCEYLNKPYGLVIDELLSQQRVVIKNLENNYKKIYGIAGATILGDGSVSLIIDTNEVINKFINPDILESITQNEKPQQFISSEHKTLNDDSLQFLSFFMAGNEYGIDILEISEIIEMRYITSIPNSPKHVKGVYNLRGTIIPILDLCEFFNFKTQPKRKKITVIVLTFKEETNTRYIGIIVDAVSNSYTVPLKTIDVTPDKQDSKLSDQARGLVMIDDKVITLLDTQKLLSYQVDDVILTKGRIL